MFEFSFRCPLPILARTVALPALGLAAGLLATAPGCDVEEGAMGSMCMADVDCKGDRICDEGICIDPEGDTDDAANEDDSAAADGASSDGKSGSSGDSGDPIDPDPVDEPLSIADSVVGAWSAEGSVSPPGEEPFDVAFGWYICSDGRMKGFTSLAGYDFLDKGSYSADESDGTITVTYTSKDTAIGDVWGPDTYSVEYDDAGDTLTFLDGNFGATMYRAEGAVGDSDCDPAW